MEKNIEYKVGDFIKIRKDLNLSDGKFLDTAPGWNSEMNVIVGKWVKILKIDSSLGYIFISYKDKFYCYINRSVIDKNANPAFAEKANKIPNIDDWVVYFESSDDIEIATIGKVTRIDELPTGTEYTIDGFSGYKNAYVFDGDLKFLEAVRNGSI